MQFCSLIFLFSSIKKVLLITRSKGNFCNKKTVLMSQNILYIILFFLIFNFFPSRQPYLCCAPFFGGSVVYPRPRLGRILEQRSMMASLAAAFCPPPIVFNFSFSCIASVYLMKVLMNDLKFSTRFNSMEEDFLGRGCAPQAKFVQPFWPHTNYTTVVCIIKLEVNQGENHGWTRDPGSRPEISYILRFCRKISQRPSYIYITIL